MEVAGRPQPSFAERQIQQQKAAQQSSRREETEKKRLTLFFEGDRLARLEGDYRPQPADQIEEVKKDTVVSIPDFVDPDRGILSKAVDAVSATWSDDAPKPKSAGGQGLSKKQEADAAELEKSMDSRAMP